MLKAQIRREIEVLPNIIAVVYFHDENNIFLTTRTLLEWGVAYDDIYARHKTKGFGTGKYKHITTIDYFGTQVECIESEAVPGLLTASDSVLCRAILSKMTEEGMKYSTRHIAPGTEGVVVNEGLEYRVFKDDDGNTYYDWEMMKKNLGFTDEDVAKMRKDRNHWSKALAELEYNTEPINVRRLPCSGEPRASYTQDNATVDKKVLELTDEELARDDLFYNIDACAWLMLQLMHAGGTQDGGASVRRHIKESLKFAGREDEYEFFLFQVHIGEPSFCLELQIYLKNWLNFVAKDGNEF